MTIDIKKRRTVDAWRVAGLAIAAALIGAWACGLRAEPDPCDPYRLSITQSVSENVLTPTFAEFEARAEALASATASWASAVEANEDGQLERQAALMAWNEVMLVWQRAELMQMGPAGSSAYVVGGEDLRDEVYSWPTVTPCRVDEELVAESYADEGFFETALVNVKGLDAIEYLSFHDGPENACAPTDTINADGSWAALDPDELTRRRSAYAAAAAAHLLIPAERLADAWAADGEFTRGLTSAGEEGSPYESLSTAVDDLMNAALYADVSVKDRKLAATSPAELESVYAGRSKEHVLANLLGLRQVLLAGDTPEAGYGFDDFLIDLEQPELATELLTELDDAIAAVEAIDGSFEDALASDPNALGDADAATKRLTDLLKGRFVTTLKLRPPGEGAGDAD